MISNQSRILQDFTLAINYGDIGYTNGGGSWGKPYLANEICSNQAATKLFFTWRHRSSGNWPTVENEVEA